MTNLKISPYLRRNPGDIEISKRVFGSTLLPVVCRRTHVLITLFVFVCLRIVMFNTYYFVFLLCFSSSMLPVFLDCSILISPSVFCNVYLVSPSGEGCNRSKMILPVEQIKYPMTLKANML